MLLSYLWTGLVFLSIFCAILTGNGDKLAPAVMEGAQSAVTLCINIAGSLCLWSGVGKLMEQAGITSLLSRLLRPLLHRVFPSTKRDRHLAACLSANICANFLGLGNAATPMGIQAARAMVDPAHPDSATDELCRLIVLNTASIQFLPTTVAALRAALGCTTPFDILPCVWLTSLCSAGLGLTAAVLLGKVRHHD